MTESHNAGSGCFSGMIRLLLCKGSHQTHPSDQITEPTITTEFFSHVKEEQKINVEAAANAPGVVARLMGLDSLPDTNWLPNRRSTAPDSVTRSRSVNFMDYLLQFDLAKANHRRVRTSVSFREVPTLLNQQNHDFYVLYMDDHAEECKKLGSVQRKSETFNPGKMKQRKTFEEESKDKESKIREGEVAKKERNRQTNMRASTLENDPGRASNNRQFSRLGSCRGSRVSPQIVSSCKKDVRRKSGKNSRTRTPVRKPINQKEVSTESKFMKRMKNKQASKDSQSDCSSEDSSTVSVLGLNEFLNIHDSTLLPHGETRTLDLNSEKISPRNTTKFSRPSPNSGHIPNSCEVEPCDIKKKDHELCGIRDKEYYIEVMKSLCRLAEEDLKHSNCTRKNAFDSEEIFAEFGRHILDSLLSQVVEELSGFHIEKS